jgi:hypothetical protein
MIEPWWLPVQVLDPQTFAGELLLNGAAPDNFARKMPADAWFDFKGSGRFEVSEQSFLLPEDEILVVLALRHFELRIGEASQLVNSSVLVGIVLKNSIPYTPRWNRWG